MSPADRIRRRAALFGIALLAACGGKPDTLPGYVEAEFTRMSSPVAGRLVALQAVKGTEVDIGAPLFVLDREPEDAAVAEAAAHVQRQKAAAADLDKGKRSEEIAVLEAQRSQFAAQLALSAIELRRQQALAEKGFISASALDTLRTRLDADRARLAEIEANLRVARLAARSDSRAAARAEVVAAEAALAQSAWRRDQKAVVAPLAGRVDDTLYRVGEWVPAGAPVVNLLAPGNVKLRFFVAQADLAHYRPGQRVEARPDGGDWFAARISRVATTPEFTPPVIYSQENRAKLVFLVEAVPEAPRTLNPGQPVDVRRAAQP